jgi:sugar phosphate isomerase/epimerase
LLGAAIQKYRTPANFSIPICSTRLILAREKNRPAFQFADNWFHMNNSTRRDFLHTTGMGLLAGAVCAAGIPSVFAAGETRGRRMTRDLVCGAIGVQAKQREAAELAVRHAFETVGADAGYLTGVSAGELAELKGWMQENHLGFGAANLGLEFRQDQARFEEGLKALPKTAAGLQRAGVTRLGTWLMPCSGTMPYVQNFRQHAARLRETAKVLKDHGVRLGLEYVGPKTSWASRRYPFIHTMAEMRELIAEIDTGNVGLVLDSWHWWNAGDTVDDLLSLKPSDVIAVDLNDAPAGMPKEQQVDSRRELPCATGVIEVAAFLKALNQIGYDGPVRVEPFNQAVNKMSKDDACAAASAALKKAFALMEG